MKKLIDLRCRRGIRPLSVALLALSFLTPRLSVAQYFNSGGPASGFDGYVTTAGCYAPLSGTAMRAITDLTVISPVGKIPLTFTRIYNSAYRTLGLGTSMGTWGTNWDYYLTQTSATAFSLQLPQGGRFSVTVSAQNTWQTIPSSGGIQFNFDGAVVQVLLTDGTTVQFWGAGAAPIFTWKLLQFIDPYGQAYPVTITTSTSGSSYPQTTTTTFKVTDPTGTRWLQFVSQITLSSAKSLPYGGIQNVTTSDGQSVSYNYTTDPSGKICVLHTVNYMNGSQATETYQDDSNGTALLLVSNEPRYAGPMKIIGYGFLSPSQWYYSGMVSYENAVGGTMSTRSIPSNSTSSAPIVVETRPDGSKRTFNGNSSGLVTKITDFLGINTTYSYNSYNQVTYVVDGTGIQSGYQRESVIGAVTEVDRNTRMLAHYTYTSTQFPYYIQTYTDANGNVTTFARDGHNRVKTITYADNTVESFTYNSWGEVTTHTLPNTGVWQYTPDPTTGNVTSATDPMGHSWTYTYDSRNRLASVYEVARGITTSYKYNDLNEVTKFTNPDGTIAYATYDQFGGRTTFQNENSQLWQWTYDEYERPATATDPLNNTTTYSYGPFGQPEWAFTNNAPVLVVRPSLKQTSFVYDSDFRLSQKTIGSGNSATVYKYDKDGNVLTVQDPLGNVTSYQYSPWNQAHFITDAFGHTTTCDYDPVGNLKTMTRPDNVVITKSYDNRNRLNHSTRSGTTAQETWQYDFAGNLNYFQDYNGNVYQWQFNYNCQKTSETLPDGSSQAWTYDNAGNLYTYTNTSNKTEQYTFDYLNRLKSRTWNTSDQYADAISYLYDPAGNLTGVANSCSTVTNQYDPDNQLQWQTQAIAGGPTVTVNYVRDPDELVASMSIGGNYGYGVQYTYNPRNQVRAILDGSGNPIASFTYDLAGNRLSRTTTGGWTSYTFDQCNRLSTQTETFPSTGGGGPTGFIPLNGNFIYPEFGFAKYTYDNIGRIAATTYTTRTDPPPDSAYSYNRSYGYDNFDNLNNIGIGDELPLLPNASFSYDPAGNRISTQLTNVFNSTTTIDYTKNNVNQYTAVGTLDPTYDQEHNLTSYNGSAYAYDWDHHLFSATNGTSDVESRCDGLGRCVSRTVNGTLTYVFYDGWNPILETNSAGAQTAARIYGPGADEIIEGFGASGNPGFFYHQNNVGSVTGITDPSGNLVEQYGYDEFGHAQIYNASGTQIATSAWGNRFLFQGREYLAAVNVYDIRNRAYSPDLGRFLQMDPIGFGGGNNLYRFVGNNPCAFTDPNGLWTMQVGIGGQIGAWIGFGGNISIAFDGAGNVGLTTSEWGQSGIWAGISLTPELQVSGANTISDLQGIGVGTYIDAGPLGAGGGFGGANQDGTVYGGLNYSLPGDNWTFGYAVWSGPTQVGVFSPIDFSKIFPIIAVNSNTKSTSNTTKYPPGYWLSRLAMMDSRNQEFAASLSGYSNLMSEAYSNYMNLLSQPPPRGIVNVGQPILNPGMGDAGSSGGGGGGNPDPDIQYQTEY
jgi:RHS repeat-associated protein